MADDRYIPFSYRPAAKGNQGRGAIARAIGRAHAPVIAAGGGALQNPEATAIVATMDPKPTGARAILIDNVVGSLKTAGVWDKLDWFCMFAGHDNQPSRINWVNTSEILAVNGVLGSTITFVADDGWAGSHVSNQAYLSTNTAPDSFTHYVQNSACMGVYYKNTQAANDGNVIGSTTTAKNSMISRLTFPAGEARGNIHGVDSTLIQLVPAPATVSGLVAVDRNSSTLIRLVHNGTEIDTTGSTSATPEATGVIVFLYQNGQAGSSQRISAGWLGASLNDTELTAMTNAIATYMAGI